MSLTQCGAPAVIRLPFSHGIQHCAKGKPSVWHMCCSATALESHTRASVDSARRASPAVSNLVVPEGEKPVPREARGDALEHGPHIRRLVVQQHLHHGQGRAERAPAAPSESGSVANTGNAIVECTWHSMAHARRGYSIGL